MKKKIKKIIGLSFCLVSLLICLIYSKDIVKAASVKVGNDDAWTYVCYNKSTGAYKGIATGKGNHTKCTNQGYGYSSVKLIDDIYAYCVNWKLTYKGSNSSYVTDSSWSKKSKKAIIAGYIINYINNNVSSKNEAYEKAAATLNTMFYKNGDSGSYNFSSNSTISGYLEKATNYYNNLKEKGYLTTKLPTPTITKSDEVLNYNATSKKYFSKKITINNLYKTYGGDDDEVTYTLTAKTTNGDNVSICTNSNGTGCSSNSVTIKDATTYSFYIYVDSTLVTSGDDITISIKGSNKSSYYSSILYKDTAYNNTQKLMTKSTASYSRSASKSDTLVVPDLVNHTIIAYKVDENGDYLSGANLELRQDTVDGKILKSTTGSSKLKYSTKDTTENNDDFFNHDYYLVETSAPDGFVIGAATIINKNSDKETGPSCYNSEGVKVDIEFCNADNYVYKCKNASGKYFDVVDNNCVSESAYTKVCYNNTTSAEVTDNNLCSVNNYSDYKYMCKKVDENSNNIYTDINEDGTCGENDTKVCYNGDTKLEASSEEYCSGNSYIYKCKDTDGNLSDLTNEGTCKYDKVCYNKVSEQETDNSHCQSGDYTKVETTNGNITVFKNNTKNLINVSKVDMTRNTEVPGAELKICTKQSYDNYKNNCEVAKTIEDIDMSWTSTDTPYSIYGIPKGEYYIIETLPPKGYKKITTAVKFTIDETGKVVTDEKEITNEEFKNEEAIVIKNQLTEFYISKRDIATKEELPGATISICRTYKDEEDGKIKMLVDQYEEECIEAILSNGTAATWVSTNEPHLINGLDAGTYYLVERIAPTDYSTAESILFTLNSDGTLTTEDGTLIEGDNKLIMYDEKIETVPTGSLSTYIVLGSLGLVSILGIGTYIYLKKKK